MIDRYEAEGEFTTRKLTEFWNTNYEDDEDFEKVIDYLNHAKNFRTFDEGLTEFIKNHGYNEKQNLDENSLINDRVEFLYKKFKEKDIYINKTTLKGYFSGKRRPDGKPNTRDNVFKLCFVLDLNVQETNEFFTKVYFDRTFNVKNYRELVYYFCIKNKKSYTEAISLIKKIEKLLSNDNLEVTDLKVHTKTIEEQTDFFTTEKELIRYIIDNKNNFNRYNVTAIEHYNELIATIQGSNDDRIFINKLKNKIKSNKPITSEDEDRIEQCGFVIRDAYKHNLLFDINLDENEKNVSESTGYMTPSSNDFMLYIIYNSKLPVRTEKDYSFKESAHLLKIIKSNFPSIHTMKKIRKESKYSFDALRKMIILLEFYSFCFNMEVYGSDSNSFDEFKDEIDDILTSSGMGPLYIGNPYDWLFLYCVKCDNPLDTFRGIINEVCEIDEEF